MSWMPHFLTLILLSLQTAAQNVNPAEEHRSMSEEFSDYLLGMNPEDIITFELGAGQRKEFFANATAHVESIKGAYSVSGGESNKIYVAVFNPGEQEIMKRESQREAVFQIKPTLKGFYKIRFSNKNVRCFAF
eukprot:TRINITY_DN12924_c0_g1_i1.p2 TRINITY_DN12924_c0_g1~~TRINITY_DN12924_c0_g1_i1.p2  ORF type:complete len:133 (+),score=35.54 TRINITY_DN12924_c0_g1_i1:143-541(+)